MFKSQVDSLLRVAEGLLLGDFPRSYPALADGFIKDFDRLTRDCRSYGLATFSLFLPEFDSFLTKGLETGRLTVDHNPMAGCARGVTCPRLFSGLWLRIFDKSGHLKQDVDVNALFFLRQISRLGKNIAAVCSPERISASVRNYHDIERRLRRPSLNWSDDRLAPEDHCGRHLGDLFDFPREVGIQSGEIALQEEEGLAFLPNVEWSPCPDAGLQRLLAQVQRVSDLVSQEIGPYNPYLHVEWRRERGLAPGFKHGPGAVSERLPPWEKSQFVNWPDKLGYTFPRVLYAETHMGGEMRLANHEPPARLKTVPKTVKSPRYIAIEPTSHMFCQQGVKAFLRDRVKATFIGNFIDFHSQQSSGDLVLQASLDRRLATVDLSDASDRLSCWTVERIFRKNPSLLSALHAARTRYVRVEIPGHMDYLLLKKFATQGTDVTFPIQSLVFLCIALGVSLDGDVSIQSINRLRNRVRIYGDDIIIPRYGYERLCRVMTYLQLKVNEAKSFKDGHFRESCGTDGYMGYDVTPVSPKVLAVNALADVESIIDTTNNLFLKGFWHASERLRASIPVRVLRATRIVGPSQRGLSGFASYSGGCESHLVKRWNSRLHRYDVRVWSRVDRSRKHAREGASPLLDFFTSQYSHEHARTVSEYVDTRKTNYGLSWEPLSDLAQRDVRFAYPKEPPDRTAHPVYGPCPFGLGTVYGTRMARTLRRA